MDNLVNGVWADCDNCIHYELSVSVEPCSSCFSANCKFEAKMQEDIVNE